MGAAVGSCCCKADDSDERKNGSTSTATEAGRPSTTVSLASGKHNRQESTRRVTTHSLMTKMALKFPRIRRVE